MIALTSSIGKTFLLIPAKRTTDYLKDNEFVDAKLQKPFLPGISGCSEHNFVMDEIIKAAKTQQRTVHTTFFDLEDAFGIVPHNLLFETVKRNHFPPSFQEYFKNLYQNAKSKGITKSSNQKFLHSNAGYFKAIR